MTIVSVGSSWSCELRSRAQFLDWGDEARDLLAFRRGLQQRLESELDRDKVGTYLGYCTVCQQHSHFTFDWRFSNGREINWREHLVCKSCGLNNRLRLVWTKVFADPVRKTCDIYCTEHLTPLAFRLARDCKRLVTSEYLGNSVPRGKVNKQGVRNEDLTNLTFPPGSFDLLLCFDVLEHVPDYRLAINEVHRVLRKDGLFALSVPFALSSEVNIVRARLQKDGKIEHLLPPEFHGDPVDPEKGVLCFYHFGWELLDDLRSCGFSDAWLTLHWSSDHAHIGNEQILIWAKK
jgi:SAM-dependent methyltransferase